MDFLTDDTELPDDFWVDPPEPEPETVTGFLFPNIRRVYPGIVASQIVSVQPMIRPLSADFIPTEYTFDPIQKHQDLIDSLALTLKVVESDAATE